MNKKDKENLSNLYELPQYESLKKLLVSERKNIATKLLLVDPANATVIANFQGQAHALKILHQKLKEINEKSQKT